MYLTTAELQERFNNKYSFGTAGSCFASEGYGTRKLQSVSDYIDYYLSDVYGTSSPLFGTMEHGTCEVPELIKLACSYLTMGQLFNSSMLSIGETQKTWGKDIYNAGTQLLFELHEAKKIFAHNGTVEMSQSPMSGNNFVEVVAEAITFDGTALYALDHRMILKGSLRVYGTTAINPVVYREGPDYEAYYYGYGTSGTHYGCLRNHGTGSLAAGATVNVDYSYLKENIFNINDWQKWANPSVEDRG